MSESLFAKVSLFYNLLDLDSNSELDLIEAKIGLTLCYEAVNQVNTNNHNNDDNSIQQPHILTDEEQQFKSQSIQKQIDFLFTATIGSNPNTNNDNNQHVITKEQFKQCYHKLLSSAYEEEVLQLDLQRAIDALQHNKQFTIMRQLLTKIKQVYNDQSQSNKLSSGKFWNTAFASISSNSTTLSSSQINLALNVIKPLIENKSTLLPLSIIINCYKQLFQYDIQPQILHDEFNKALSS